MLAALAASQKIVLLIYLYIFLFKISVVCVGGGGFTPFRKDREIDTTGGGVFILVKDCFVASEQKQFKTNCEIILVNLNIASAKTLFVAAYYRRKEGDAQGAEELQRSIEMVSKTNVWSLGDFNYPNFSWDADHVPFIKPGCSYPNLYDDFMTMLDDFSLVQMVTEPTRHENVLDLFLTTNHTLVQKTVLLTMISWSQMLMLPHK